MMDRINDAQESEDLPREYDARALLLATKATESRLNALEEEYEEVMGPNNGLCDNTPEALEIHFNDFTDKVRDLRRALRMIAHEVSR